MYAYDTKGHLQQKQYPNGMQTLYAYTKKGQLESLTHQDSKGILDHYHYTYDIQGNKTEIQKQRRGLEQESGTYHYGYDSLQRLTQVTKDESLLRGYTYDALGNRSTSTEPGKMSSQYTYNAMNQLIARQDMGIEGEQLTGNLQTGNLINEEKYTYDKRGNLTEVFKNNKLVNQYHFGALNRLEKAVSNQTGEASIYQYNGLGHRVGKIIGNPVEPSLPTDNLQNLTINPTKQIEDTIDLTKQYHNLLQRREDNHTTAYTWDSNVLHAVGGEERNTSEQNHYQYLQDELGSPIRLFSPNGDIEEIYSYDEFGQKTHVNQELISQHKNAAQPFGYTGYQRDSVANTYYAQAREYRPEVGRFTGEDIVKGNVIHPITLNQYTYCWSSPMGLVDLDGLKPTEVEAAYMAQNIYKATKDDYGKDVGGGWKLESIMTGKEGLKIGAYAKVDTNGKKEYALVNKGTSKLSDWKNNFQQPFGNSVDMRESIKKAETFVDRHFDSEVTMVGHSKGGAEAAANALKTNTNCIVFNPATVFAEQYGLTVSGYTADMNVYIIKGEILNSILEPMSQPIDNVEYLDGLNSLLGIRRLLNHSMEEMIKVLEKKYGVIGQGDCT